MTHANRILRALPALAFIGLSVLAAVPNAESCQADVNMGYCGKGCKASVNAGACHRGCEAKVNLGRCGEEPSDLESLTGIDGRCAASPESDSLSRRAPDADCVLLDRVRTYENPCPDQSVHIYESGLTFGAKSWTIEGGGGVGGVTVEDSNIAECDGNPLTIGDWDGDADMGRGGGFFGYGTHAINDVCNYRLNVHGGHVRVQDLLWGSEVAFLMGEDDQDGPIVISDPEGNVISCFTSGAITPGLDEDDCYSDGDPNDANNFTPYVGSGDTCGTGGGDGGYWVFLLGVEVAESGNSVTVTQPPTRGTITAS